MVIRKNKTGFTIVELLVVIVVIAILAAITLVTYNGLQKRAGTVAYTQAADDLEKQLRIAMTTGDFVSPPGTEEGFGYGLLAPVFAALGMPVLGEFCIGDVSDYPAKSGFAAGECYRQSGPDGTASIMVDEEYSSRLTDAGIELPSDLPIVRRTVNGVNIASRGVYAISGDNGTVILLWSPPDSSSCGRADNYAQKTLSQIEEQGGAAKLIDDEIEKVKSDPAKIQEMKDRYGEDWEGPYRSYLTSTFGTDRIGACILSIDP